MRRDITEGLLEFHRDENGDVSIVERDPDGGRPDIVIVPAEVWQRVWPQLVSLAEMRKLSSGQYP